MEEGGGGGHCRSLLCLCPCNGLINYIFFLLSLITTQKMEQSRESGSEEKRGEIYNDLLFQHFFSSVDIYRLSVRGSC